MVLWRVLVLLAISFGPPTFSVAQSVSNIGRNFTYVQLLRLAAELSVPKNIPIPADIPSYELMQGEANKKPTAVFGVAKYHKAYFESWNEQLYQYGFLNLSRDVRARMSGLTSLKSDRYRGRGAHQGKVDCFGRIERLRRTHGDTVARRAARLAYVQLANADLTFVRTLGDTYKVRDSSTITTLEIEFTPNNKAATAEQDGD